MDRKIKQHMLLIAFGVGLYAALMNLGTVFGLVSKVLGLAVPVVAGFVIAFVLNVPMSGLEKLLQKFFSRCKKKPGQKWIDGISLVLTLIFVACVITLVFTMLLPELAASVMSLYDLVVTKGPELVQTLLEYDIDISWITKWLEGLNIGKLLENITTGAGSIISSAVNIASSAVSVATTVVISLIIAIYALLSKRDLARQAKKLAAAYLKPSMAEYVFHVANLIKDLYSKFLSGQCVEACILGVLMVITLNIFHVPYASLIGVLAAVGTLIPYVGSFFACAVGAFLVLLADPGRVLLCVVVYLVVQFVENQFIYPHVVGTSVGLSALWTLVAVLIGGEIMGLLGMIFFIPLTAVLVTLVREHMEARLARIAPEIEKNEGSQ